MNKKKFTKLLALYLPYLVIGLAATNLGEAGLGKARQGGRLAGRFCRSKAPVS